MGAGSSKERISKADMEFLLLHTHYDEKTIQGKELKHCQSKHCLDSSQEKHFLTRKTLSQMFQRLLSRMVQRLHVWLPWWKTQHSKLHENLLKMFSSRKCCGILWSCFQVSFSTTKIWKKAFINISICLIKPKRV